MPDLTLTLPASLLLDVEERGGADWVLSLVVGALDQEMRKCVVCRLPKPLSKYKGDHKRCDDCSRRMQASQVAVEPETPKPEPKEPKPVKPKREKLPQSDTAKVCSKCREIKPLDGFNVDPRGEMQRLRAECKDCEQARKKKAARHWYEKNKETHISKVKANKK